MGARIYVHNNNCNLKHILFLGEHIGFLVERESIRQMLDLKSVQVALLYSPELYRYISNNTLGDETFLKLLPCDTFQLAVVNKTFLHGLKKEVLIKITGLTGIRYLIDYHYKENGRINPLHDVDFFTCILQKSWDPILQKHNSIEAKELLEDRQLVEKLPPSHIGFLLEKPSTRKLVTEKAVSDFLIRDHSSITSSKRWVGSENGNF